MEREKPALHAQGSIFRQKLVPLFNVESHAQAEACVVHGEPVVIFHNCTLPNRTIEQLGHGRGIEARTFAIGQGAQEETTFIVHSNGTMPVLRHLKPNGWKGAFIRKERGLILPDTCKRLCHRCFALLASVAMRVESKVLIVAFFCMLVSSFLQRIIEQIFPNPETISHRAVMMPLLFAPLSKQRPIQRRGGTRKNSLIYKRALAHAVPRSGRNKRNAHSNGHPAFCASKEVMEKKSGSSASIKSTGNRTKSASKYLATTCARSGERW